ncbi:MAG: DUF4159 domain-containing protein [Pirellulaceae bacterium]|jgi:hypothetical protein|nr:DUF4159 domain-containing protein [Pirellulaceae bacterium]
MYRPLRCTSLVLLIVFGLVASSFAQRKVGTIGPPPRKNPQRQTSAEGFPPLPLPVTPLRRSEPKAEPSPPLFTAKLIYGDDQDYMPNPGDVDNLMRHARYELGLWYGWKVLSLKELVALHKQGKRSKLPMLQMTGYEAFELTSDQREALRQYVLDGGTLFGDATLGSPEFTQSFRNEVRTMFPDRSFDLLQVDHPIYRAYHTYTNVHYFDVDQGYDFQTQGPPELLGMNVGTRTAVILSPHDMSCGWDEFIAPSSKTRVPNAPRDKAMIPGDAIRLGLNIVSYVAALREVGDIESVTRHVVGPRKRARQTFTLAQLRHQGDWNPDPNSTYQWLRHLSQESSLSVGFDLKFVDPAEPNIAAYPFLFITGFRNPKFTDQEKEALRRHIAAGGFLFINNCSGFREFDQHVRQLIGELFADQELSVIDQEHAIYKSFYNINEIRDRRSGTVRVAELEGITVKDRLVVVYSKNDMITHLKQISDPFGNGFDAESCRQLAINLVSYVLQN